MAAIRPGRPGGKRPAQPQQAAPEAPPPPPAPPKGRSLTVPAIVVAVALLGAAFLLRGGGGDDSTTQAATSPTSAPVEEGPVVALSDITMNLAGGDHLKVAIALQLAAGAEVPEDATAYGARALDVAIEVLGDFTRQELEAHGGRTKAKEQLTQRVAAEYHDEVLAVYFTQFVIA